MFTSIYLSQMQRKLKLVKRRKNYDKALLLEFLNVPCSDEVLGGFCGDGGSGVGVGRDDNGGGSDGIGGGGCSSGGVGGCGDRC